MLFRKVERTGDDADRGVFCGEATAEVLEMSPVVAVKTFADLGTHVGEVEGIIHGSLGEFAVGGRDLMAAVVAGAEVVRELCTELFRN